MKKILLLFTVIMLSVPSFGAGPIETKGDDLFPWPWGTECPFPWKEISGSYVVQSKVSREYSKHYLYFEALDEPRGDLKFLNITQYDRRGYLYAQGRGYSQKDQRVVKGVLSPLGDAKDYVVMVRSYVKDTKLACKGSNLVTAVTFCSLRGKKCLEDSNYVLVKLKD